MPTSDEAPYQYFSKLNAKRDGQSNWVYIVLFDEHKRSKTREDEILPSMYRRCPGLFHRSINEDKGGIKHGGVE
jgi:hypothetical protein